VIEPLDDLRRSRQVRIAGGHIGDEPGLAGGAELLEALLNPHYPTPSRVITPVSVRICSTLVTSLSPRPDRFTSSTASAPNCFAALRTCAIACDDSRAGRMPSRRASSWNPTSASSSVA